MYYHKYKDILEEAGYTVGEDGRVHNDRGYCVANEDRHGNVYCFDPNVNNIIKKSQSTVEKVKKAVKKAAPKGMKRARNSKGHFIKDDPNTPENEAWVQDSDYGQGKL
jgi:hypothetical protein